MKIKKVETINAPKAVGAYVQANVVNDMIFCSGQLGINPITSKIVEGGVVEETKQIFKNISAILNAGGSNMDCIVKTTIYIKNISDFKLVNEIYSKQFNNGLPARSTVGVSSLPLDANIEIEVIALVKYKNK